jgi:hypothetical protein
MTDLLHSYNKINNIMKQPGHSNEYKRLFNQLNDDEKYAVKKLKIINNNNKQKQNRINRQAIAMDVDETSSSEEDKDLIKTLREIIKDIKNKQK